MNHWLLKLLLDAIGESIRGEAIIACRYMDPILSISLAGNSSFAKRYSCIVSVLGRSGPFFFASPDDVLSKCPSVDVLPKIRGSSIDSIAQFRNDRIVEVRLGLPTGATASLYVTLFGRTGRVIVRSGNDIIDGIDIRESALEAVGGERAIPFAAISEEKLNKALSENLSVPGLDGPLRDCFSRLDPAGASLELIDFRNEIDSISTGIDIKRREFSLVYYKKPADSVPAPIAKAEALSNATVLGPFGNILQACSVLGDLVVEEQKQILVEAKIKPIRKFLESKVALLQKLEKQRELALQHETVRREAETLAAYQSKIPAGCSKIELPDPYGAGAAVKITLDPSRSVQEQIQKRFKTAAKMKRSIGSLDKRIKQVGDGIEELKQKLASISESQDLGQVFKVIENILSSKRIPPHPRNKAHKTQEKHYRKFDLDPMWFVLVGRSNRENDELTFTVASASDYWLHAQNVPGSHVILRSKGTKQNPPYGILVKAAQIAAHFSKARNSSLVPVIYTQRKYVRKPRKAPPGKVMCTMEKTLFVEPGIP